ncbi:50S ribosomal protein L25, partial [Mycobacterium tuberculosis]|nr:50S ribosomal protein L25 [Mycobacterium tuberculosis]
MAKSASNQLRVTVRTETGKGASRRARRAGKIPAVLYGHGAEPQHLELPGRGLVRRHA